MFAFTFIYFNNIEVQMKPFTTAEIKSSKFKLSPINGIIRDKRNNPRGAIYSYFNKMQISESFTKQTLGKWYVCSEAQNKLKLQICRVIIPEEKILFTQLCPLKKLFHFYLILRTKISFHR